MAVLPLLGAFAVVPNTVQALTAASMLAALSRIAYRAGGWAGLTTVLSIAALAGLLPVWVFGLRVLEGRPRPEPPLTLRRNTGLRGPFTAGGRR